MWRIKAFSTRFSTRLWKTVENLWASVNYRPWAMWISRFFGDFFEKIQKNLICNILMYSCNFVILFINLLSLCRRFLKICGVWSIGFKIAGHEKSSPFFRLICWISLKGILIRSSWRLRRKTVLADGHDDHLPFLREGWAWPFLRVVVVKNGLGVSCRDRPPGRSVAILLNSTSPYPANERFHLKPSPEGEGGPRYIF